MKNHLTIEQMLHSAERLFVSKVWRLLHRSFTPDPEQAKGVLRRLRVVESASDFNGVVRGVRTLIMLMRGADVQIDYGSLARDLYLIQLPSQRGKVFQSWGRDYYYSKQSSNNNR